MNNKTPLSYYEDYCQQGLITPDPEQRIVLNHLHSVFIHLVKEQRKRDGVSRLFRKPKLVHGLYIWGGVGIGKTFLMDCFYHSLPFKNKLRMHFHQFMRMIHEQLKQHQGEKNPLDVIATEIAKQTTVLCFDEFFVNDIADAMILARLLKALFIRGVCLIATSNTMPDNLYYRGLQRPLFLPAIALLKQHTTVLHVPTQIDYRLRHLKLAGAFYTPNDEIAAENMAKSFAIFAEAKPVTSDPIHLNGRNIQVIKRSDDIIWFDFADLCHIPRSQHDYLAIAERYHTVLLGNIPAIPPNAKDKIALFIRLIDVLYDARVRLIFSAAVDIDGIYTSGTMAQDFVRTKSRLLEMQSEDYFTAGLRR